MRNPIVPHTPVRTLTLLELVSELVEAGADDREVVATVLHLIETGRIRPLAQTREVEPDSYWIN